MITTVGRLLVNQVLPEDLRKDDLVLDKKGVHSLLQKLADKHPEQFPEVLAKLNDIGRNAGWTDGVSVSLSGLRRSRAKQAILDELKPKLDAIRDDDTLTDEQRRDAIVSTVLPYTSKLEDALLEEAKSEGNNPYYTSIVSGARGKKSDLASMRGTNFLVADQNDNLVPVPILRSYAEGYKPADYFAASYGQRKGAVSTKFLVADAGYISKLLINAAHRLVVTKDKPPETRLPVGLPFDLSDKDIIGSVLAHDVGPHKAGTVITSKVRDDLLDEDHKEVLVHSPLTEPSEDGGVSAYAAGVRERAGLNRIGDNIGITSAQSVGEKLSQDLLSAKHSAGVGKGTAGASGVEYIYRMLGAPEEFPEAGPLAEEDGQVEQVRQAPQGGHYIRINGKDIYTNPGLKPAVKEGDSIEAGDDLTDGVPHPQQLVKYRGLGEARRVYSEKLFNALKDSGVVPNKRHIHTIVSGFLNWARVTNPNGIGDNIVDDVVPYNRLTYNYKPRQTAQLLAPNMAKGKYLEEPVLHYSVGTRVNSKVMDRLKQFGVKDINVHDEPPDFEPEFVRGVLGVYNDPDWQTRLGGFYTAKAFQNAVHRGAESDSKSTSWIPALSKGQGFGNTLTNTGHYG